MGALEEFEGRAKTASRTGRSELMNRYMLAAASLLMCSCSPKVAVEVPDKPITINLNVKIDHEVRVKVEKDLEKVISPKSDLF